MNQDPWRASSSTTASSGRSSLRRTGSSQGFTLSSVTALLPTSKRTRLLFVAVSTCIAGMVFTSVLASSDARPAATGASSASVPTVEALPTAPSDAQGRITYHMTLDELDGMPANIHPWTKIELWVAWDPPITDEPLVQLLNDDIYVESVLPPVVQGGSHVVKLAVRPKDRVDLVYADRYGALSVMIAANQTSD